MAEDTAVNKGQAVSGDREADWWLIAVSEAEFS